MAESVGYATLNVIPSAKDFGKKLGDQVDSPLGEKGKSGGAALGAGILGAATSALGPIAGVMAGVFATASIVNWGKEQINALARIESINTQTASVIKSTGGAANVTAESVEKLAGKLEGLTGTEAESIQEGANLLLTFKNIRNEAGAGNDIFDQTTTAMVDMARAMGTDASGGAMQLGKALNDPVAGIAALSRVGITFSEDQKDLIKTMVETGDIMGAQKIILGELNSQFGGSGAAYAQTYAGKIDLLGHAWGTFGETLFSGVMPALGGSTSLLTDLINVATGVVDILFNGNFDGGLFAAFGIAEDSGLVDFLFTVREAALDFAAGIQPILAGVGPGLANMFATLGPALAQLGTALLQLLPNISPIGILFQGLAPLLPLIGQHLAQMATVLAGVLTEAVTSVAPVVAVLANVISEVLAAALPVVMTLFEALSPVLLTAAQLFGTVISAVAPLVSLIADLLIPIIQALLPVVQIVFGFIADIIKVAMGVIQGVIGVVSSAIAGDWDAVWTGVQSILTNAWNGIIRAVDNALGDLRAWFEGLWPAIQGWLGDVGSWLFDVGSDLIAGLLNGIGSMASDIWGAIVGPIEDAVAGVRDLLGIHSPSRVFRSIGVNIGQGLIGGMDSMEGRVENAANNLAAAALSADVESVIPEGGLHGVLVRNAAATDRAIVLNYTQNGGQGFTEEQELIRAARRLKYAA